MKPKPNAIYASVKDMDRAVKFYEEVFDKKVSVHEEKMSVFSFDDFSFLLFNNNEEVVFGNNIVPNIQVENAKEMLGFLKEKNCLVVSPLKKVDQFLLFQIKDTEGNIVEFYQTL